MDFGNIVVLVVTIIAVIYSLMKSARGAAPRDPDEPFEDEEEREHARPQRAPVPPPLPPPLQTGPKARELPPEKKFATEKFTFHAKLDDFKTKTAIDDRSLQIGLHTPDELISDAVRLAETEGTLFKRKKEVLVRQMLKSLPHKKLLWLSHEIVATPVSRRLPFPWNK